MRVGADEFFRFDPKDKTTDDRREALYALEEMLSDSPSDYIQMVGMVVGVLKKAGK